jgi:hypothetical protein
MGRNLTMAELTRLEGNTLPVGRSAGETFAFLSDLNNFRHIMPEQVVGWESTTGTCRFTIQGMATLGMKITGTTPDRQVKLVSDGKVPFDFALECRIEPAGDHCTVQMIFDAALNPMLKMMAAKPLTNFLNMMTGNLAARSGASHG